MRELTFIEKFLKSNMDYARDKYLHRSELTVTTKAHANDLLTEVDLTIQKRAIDQIGQMFPDDFFMGEEGEKTAYPSDPDVRCWVMDPIDGTSNFVRGIFPIFGISLAFAVDGEAAAAGVAFPGTGDVFLAARGQGSTRNGKRIRVSEVQAVDECQIDFDFGSNRDRTEMFTRASQLMEKVGQLRCFGSAVASICQVASGDADAYLHMSLHPWDYAAAQLIVEEAGGMSTRLDGSPLRIFDGGRGTLFSNGALHNALLGGIKTR
jgi:myo-inositol-1(or 4)-monophosphatase